VNELRNYGLENKQLNDILNFKSESEYSFITAKIVSRLVSKVSGYIVISKGTDDGVRKGMPVITDKGLVGIVLDTDNNYSSVRTFENSLFKVAVKDQRSNVDGVLNWDGRNLVIKNMPTTYDVEVGDRIIISELSSILPPSIPVGIIIEKETTLSGVLSNLIVQPFVNLTSIKNVIVLEIETENQLDSLANKLLGGDK
jgi:rod shape-determining protein MreC